MLTCTHCVLVYRAYIGVSGCTCVFTHVVRVPV